MNSNITDQFIEGLYELSKERFSEADLKQVKRCLLDYLGATFAGAQMLQQEGNSIIEFLGVDAGNVSAIGFNRKTDLNSAVFVNGLSAHVAELDDGVRFGMIHPGSPIFSALLSVAEKEKAPFEDLSKGVIVAYETAVRLASAIQPSHYKMGYHPTATCGSIGAALGIGAMLGFSKSQMKNTLSAAVVSASGSLKVLESELKPFNVGQASLKALIAATTARAGIKGPSDALSGESGFFKMMAMQVDKLSLLRGTDDELLIHKVYVKPYAACRHAHPTIEAILKIRANSNIDIESVQKIKIITYDGIVGKHDHKEIAGVSSAKMSIPFSAALALVKGKAGIKDFNKENVEDNEILSLVRRVEIATDKEISQQVPEKRIAVVEVTTDNGRQYVEKVEDAKGEPENPLTDMEIKDKFTSLTLFAGKSKKESEQLIRTVWNLENKYSTLFELL